jgi:hypothetical protein
MPIAMHTVHRQGEKPEVFGLDNIFSGLELGAHPVERSSPEVAAHQDDGEGRRPLLSYFPIAFTCFAYVLLAVKGHILFILITFR